MGGGGEMENESGRRSIPILREWFDRVDSDNKGNITAAQLKVKFLPLPQPTFIFNSFKRLFLVMVAMFISILTCCWSFIRVLLPSETFNFLSRWSSKWSGTLGTHSYYIFFSNNIRWASQNNNICIGYMFRMYDFDRNGTMSFPGNTHHLYMHSHSLVWCFKPPPFCLFGSSEFVELNKFLLKVSLFFRATLLLFPKRKNDGATLSFSALSHYGFSLFHF